MSEFRMEFEKSNGGIPYKHCTKCGIKEEETVMTNTPDGWFCCDCYPPTMLCKESPTAHEMVNKVIGLLNNINIDGETMQYILGRVGMEDQMLSQLVRGCEDRQIVEELLNESDEAWRNDLKKN